MKTKIFNTSALIYLILLIFLCSVIYTIFPPTYPGLIFYCSILISISLCVGISLLFTLPKRIYISNIFQIVSWTYVVLFIAGTSIALYYFAESSNPLADLTIKAKKLSDNNRELSLDDKILIDQLRYSKDMINVAYFSILLCVSAITFIILLYLRKHDIKYANLHHIVDKEQEKLLYSERMMIVSDKYKSLCKARDIYPISNYKIERLANEIYYLTKAVLEIPNSEAKLEHMIKSLDELVNDMGDTKTDRLDHFNDKIKSLVNEHLVIIKEFKDATEKII